MDTTQRILNEAQTEKRWRAVASRQPIRSDPFLYAVRTTGIYCRIGCASRIPNRENVRFFDDNLQAEAAGFRPCRRCKPAEEDQMPTAVALTIAGCRLIESSDSPPTLQEIADHVGRSKHHYQKLFRSQIGVTPKDYAMMTRVNRFICLLKSDKSVLDAIYAAGYSASSRCYEESNRTIGMSPDRYRRGGEATAIQYGVSTCSLGHVLVATTELGICRVAIGDNQRELANELRDHFSNAVVIESDNDLALIVKAVVQLIDGDCNCHDFPLDICGTAFQRKVWQALQRLPAGKTVTYSELAKSIGRPDAVRAVATACGANAIAVLIPCHRVIRADGGLGGYRWGLERKQKLLDSE